VSYNEQNLTFRVIGNDTTDHFGDEPFQTVNRTATRGIARILHWGSTKAERRKRENRGAKALRGMGIGRGCPPRNRLGDLGERRGLPSGVRGKDRATNAFLAYLRPTKTYARENSVTSQQSQFFSRKKSTQ